MSRHAARTYALLSWALLLTALAPAGCDQINPFASSKEGAVESMRTAQPFAAPLWILPDLTGQTRRLEEFRGQIVLLNFWATWCPPCRGEIPDLIQIDQTYRARGVDVVGISMDDDGARAVQAFVERFGITYPVVLGDLDTAARYRVSGIPTSYLVDRAGRVVKRWVGPYSQEAFAAQIEALLAQEAK